MKDNQREKILENQKGSVTLFVLIAILFFLFIVFSIFTNTKNKGMAQLSQLDEIQKNYEQELEHIDDIYEEEVGEDDQIEFTTNFIKSSSISSGNKVYYDIDEWTNEDIVLEIILKDETLSEDMSITVKPDNIGEEKTYTYNQVKNNEVIITENSKVTITIDEKEESYHLTKFDKEKPSVSYQAFFEKDNTNYTSGKWTNKETYTKIDAIENISGIQSMEYSNDKNSWITLNLEHSNGIKQESGNKYYGEELWTIREERIESVYFRVKDLAGNYSEPSTVYDIRYDTLAPTIPNITSEQEGKWVGETIDISADSTDTVSKVEKFEYSYDQSAWKSDWKNVIQIEGNRAIISENIATSVENMLYIRAVDNAGNISEIGNLAYKRDVEKPTVTISPNGGNILISASGSARIETILDAKDTGGSELEILKYGWSTSSIYEPDEWIDFKNGEKILKSDITGAGTFYLWTNVVDTAGNRAEEILVSQPFIIQTADVDAYEIYIKPNTTEYTNQNVIGTVQYGSGLIQNRKAGYGQTEEEAMNFASEQTAYLVTATENGVFYAEAQDAQGNPVTATLEIGNIDKIPPMILISKNGGTMTMPIQGKATITTQVTVTDEGVSGIDTDTLLYGWSTSKDSEPTKWETYTNGQTLEEDVYEPGTYYLWVKAGDIAGNQAENFKISEPFIINPNSETDTSITITRNPEGWTNQDVIGTIQYGRLLTQNRKAGFGITEAEAIAAASSSTANEVIVPQNGYIYAEATDEYGTKVTKTLYVDKIDKTKPRVTLNPNGGTFILSASGDTTIKTTISATDEENGSGLDKLQYGWSTSSKTEPGEWEDFTNNSIISKSGITSAGTYYLWTKVTDKVGNEAVDIKISNAFNVVENTGLIKITATPTTPTKENVKGTVSYDNKLVENTRKAGYGKTLEQAKQAASYQTAYNLEAIDNGYFYATAEDSTGNIVEEILHITNIDRIPPTVTLNPNGGTFILSSSGTTTIKTTISATDAESGLGLLQYGWSTSSTIQPSRWEPFNNNSIISKSDITSAGKYYLWTNVKDKAGNEATDIKVSQAFNVVSGDGLIVIKPSTTGWTKEPIYGDVTYSDTLVESSRKAGFGKTLEEAKRTASQNTAYRVTATENGVFYATAQDNLNNVIETSVNITTIDTQSPTAQFSINGGNYAMPTTGYGKLKTTVTVSDTGGSGINPSTLKYGWSTSSYTAPLQWKTFTNGGEVSKTDITSTGNYYLWIQAEDNAGNEIQTHSNAFNMGRYQIDFSYTDSNWSSENITSTVTYPTVLSEDRKAGFGITENDAQNAAKNNATTVTATQNGWFYAEASDIMGNKVTSKVQVTKMDKIAPEVSFKINGGNYAMPSTGYGKLKTIVNVSDSNGSGINTNTLKYGWSTSIYTAPLQWKTFTNGGEVSKTDITSTGNYYLWIQAEDNAGNEIQTYSNAFNMGTYQISFSYTDNSWSNENVTSTVTYPTILSQNKKAGFGTTESGAQSAARANATSVTATQTGYFYAEASDVMGNKVTKIIKVNIDKINPTATITPDGGEYIMSSGIWGSATIKVTIVASDTGGSGLSKVEYGWTTSSYSQPTSWTECTSGREFSKSAKQGTYYLWARATDNAGNQVIQKSNAYTVYSSTSSEGKITITPDETEWTNQNVNVTIEYGSALVTSTRKAGFGTTQTQAKNNAKTSTAQKITVTENGWIYAVAEDSSGNEVTATYEITNIDKVAPTINYVRDTKEVIQDGLVYNLSGENNTGTGHSSSTRTWKDLSGNGFDGTISGATWSGNALSFDGRDDYVTFDNPLNAEQLTFEVTLSLDNTSDGQFISNIEWGGEALSINRRKPNMAVNYTNQDSYETAYATTTCSTGKIYTITGTFDGRTIKIYVNGVLEGSKTVTSGTRARQKADTTMVIGKNPYGRTESTNTTEFLDGKIYTARMYSRALSATEVKQNYYADQYATGQVAILGGQGYDSLSGLVGYQFSTSSSLTASSSGWKTISKTTSTYTITDELVSGSGNFYLYLKDAAGNVAKKRKNDFVSYTITYNDGNRHTTRKTKYAQEEIGSAPVTFRQGYYFKGWYSSASGGSKIDVTDRVTSNKTIYGQWTKISTPTLTFSAYINGTGWSQNSGNQAGTIGQQKSIDSIKIDTSSSKWIDGEITYSIHQADIGDDIDWKFDGAESGDKVKMGQAFRVKLGGRLEKHYDVYYKAHVQTYGWLGWAKNGEYAGTIGYGKRLEAIKIQLVAKGSNPPAEDSQYGPNMKK